MGWYRARRRKTPREKENKDEDTGPQINMVVKGLIDLKIVEKPILIYFFLLGDVDGSLEAILDVIETYDDQERCKLSLVHYGVGNVNETDIEMASAFEGSL